MTKNNKKNKQVPNCSFSEIEKKKEKEWLLLTIFAAISLLCLIYIASIQEIGSRLHYKCHNSLFFLCILFLVVFVISRNNTKSQFKHFLSMIKFNKNMSLSDLADGVIFLIYIICFLAFLFILDISFLSNYGVRISGVVGVLLFRIIKTTFFNK